MLRLLLQTYIGGGKLVKHILDHNATHIKLNVSSKNPWRIWRNINVLCQIIKKYKVEIVHARSRAPAWSSYYATLKTSTCFITTFHGLYSYNNCIKKYYNSIMIRSNRIIAVSNFIKNHLIQDYQVPENKISLIYRGIDYNYFCTQNINPNLLEKFKHKYSVPSDAIILLLPARFSKWKGHTVLLEALKLIKNLNFYCIFAGDMGGHPDFVERIRKTIIEYKLQSKVRLFGPEENTLYLYALAHIILSTSIEPEAFGRTIIEAQSMEKIVIATNIGGAIETITNEVTGFHFEKNNYIELSEKIKYVISIINNSVGIQLTTAARQNVIKNFSLEQMQSQTLQLYKESI